MNCNINIQPIKNQAEYLMLKKAMEHLKNVTQYYIDEFGYDPSKPEESIELNDIRLEPNETVNGIGEIYQFPYTGDSTNLIMYGDKFRYNYDRQELQLLMPNDPKEGNEGNEGVEYAIEVPIEVWAMNPRYCMEYLIKEFERFLDLDNSEDDFIQESKSKGVKITEDYNIFINKPLKEFLATLDGKTSIELKTSGDLPHFGGRVLQITWQYADKPIKSIEETERGLIVSLDR